MESDRRNLPEEILVAKTDVSIEAINESIESSDDEEVIAIEKPLVDILSEKDLENIGKAINGRNPWEH